MDDALTPTGLLLAAATGDTVVLPPCDWGYWAALGRQSTDNALDDNDLTLD